MPYLGESDLVETEERFGQITFDEVILRAPQTILNNTMLRKRIHLALNHIPRRPVKRKDLRHRRVCSEMCEQIGTESSRSSGQQDNIA